MSSKAYVTLLTKAEYLSGVLVLNYSIKAVNSQYPLVVMVTPLVTQHVREILGKQDIKIYEVETLMPEEGRHSLSEHDTRFHDTWSKLRVFGLSDFERVVLLDADMIVLRNMDELLDLPLAGDEIAAAHACACNPRKLPHYPTDWYGIYANSTLSFLTDCFLITRIPANCAHTAVPNPQAPPPTWSPNTPRPYGQLNSGTVVVNPSKELADAIIRYLNTEDISKFSFPDQDLLAAFFKGKWKPLPWYYNALKTLKVIHVPEWDDNEIRCLHYILHDKPWKARESSEGEPAYIEFNNWWWDRYEQMLMGLEAKDQNFVRSTIGLEITAANKAL
ncbi:hypothetical protein MPER_07441 [Moniliophthora perniciosa FA553]|nr:hypothetical protein MPER_07441 [Moniliophthora perniciosa FA553]